MKKPTGHSGTFRVSSPGDGTFSTEFQKINFPTKKAEIEKIIASWFVESLGKKESSEGRRPTFNDLVANAERDLDFSVATERGTGLLELQEVAPLSGPYTAAPTSHTPYDRAQYVLSKIHEKSNKYGSRGATERFLLIYTTHFSFSLSDTAINSLRVWLDQAPPLFDAVFSFAPLTWGEGVTEKLYPVPADLRDFDPETIKTNVCFNLNPSGWQLGRS